jgi:LacI family transcriptional regulator
MIRHASRKPALWCHAFVSTPKPDAMSSSPRSANQLDVARAAGVSRATVSNAYLKPHLLEAGLLAKVLNTAQALGYRPHLGARATRRGRFDCIAFLQDAQPGYSHLARDLLLGIDHALAGQDRYLTFAEVGSERLGSSGTPKVLRSLVADGLLLNFHGDLPPRLADGVAASGLPAIWINRHQPLDAIVPDDRGAGRAAAQHLLELGHRRIAWLGHVNPDSSPNHSSYTERRQGLRDGIASAGLQLRECEIPDPGPRPGEHPALLRLLQGRQRPTAIVCYGIEAGWTIGAAWRLGLSLPDDCSLLTFGDEAFNLGREVTTFTIPWMAMGEAAVELVLGERGDGPLPTKALPLALAHPRETCGPV